MEKYVCIIFIVLEAVSVIKTSNILICDLLKIESKSKQYILLKKNNNNKFTFACFRLKLILIQVHSSNSIYLNQVQYRTSSIQFSLNLVWAKPGWFLKLSSYFQITYTRINIISLLYHTSDCYESNNWSLIYVYLEFVTLKRV